MWKQVNGGLVKVLAVAGVVGIILLMLIALDWIARVALDVETGEVTKWFTAIFTLVLGGSAGAKYVSGLEVTKKEDGPDG
jgi:hypothetical protein